MKLLLSAKRLPLCVAVALLILTAGRTQAQDGQRPECFVISAGVDNYPNANRLNGCLSDAMNTSAAFQAQEGTTFDRVHVKTLLDGQATQAALHRGWQSFTKLGRPGDTMVLFLSGHGGTDGRGWHFLPFDYHSRRSQETQFTDVQILETADALARQGKKVVIIVDACYAGQVGVRAQSMLSRYRDRNAGGIVLMLSSGANQLSSALGDYSAFAKAFADSMTSQGDLNRDGTVTISEIKSYSYKRTYDLLQSKGISSRQDSEVVWSPSIAPDLAFAGSRKPSTSPQPPVVAQVPPVSPTPPPAPPATTNERQAREWVGSETLPGFGGLSLQFQRGGRVVMTDARGVVEGTYEVNGFTVRMWFDNGRIFYTGVVDGRLMSGTAQNDRTTWAWTVQDMRPAK